MNSRSEAFNDLLDAMLDGLESTRSEIDIFRFDIESRFSEIVNDPSSFGFANVTHEAAPGLVPGAQNYNEALIVSDPNAYLFWDELHPTAAGHALLAEEALRVLLPPGDYNRDWVVDLADYALWRDSLGSTSTFVADGDRSRVVDGGDYDLWSANFGTGVTVASGGSQLFQTPEPSGWPWFAAILLLIARFRYRTTRRSASDGGIVKDSLRGL